jgi:hypothetical protein
MKKLMDADFFEKKKKEKMKEKFYKREKKEERYLAQQYDRHC